MGACTQFGTFSPGYYRAMADACRALTGGGITAPKDCDCSLQDDYPPPSHEARVAFALAFVDGVRPRLRLVQDEETYFRQWHCTDPFGDVVGRAWTAEAAYAAWASRFAGLGGIRQPVSIP